MKVAYLRRWKFRNHRELLWPEENTGRARGRLSWLTSFVLLGGFCAGLGVPELMHMGDGSYAGYASLYSFRAFETAGISPESLFSYLVRVRIMTLLFLWMSSYTAAGMIFHFLLLLWLGGSAGMLLALFALRDGYEGILLFFCCLFPQWVFYGIAWKMEFHFLYCQWVDRAPADERKIREFRRRDLVKLGRMTVLVLLGCAAETFVGMWTIKIFLQFFT